MKVWLQIAWLIFEFVFSLSVVIALFIDALYQKSFTQALILIALAMLIADAGMRGHA